MQEPYGLWGVLTESEHEQILHRQTPRPALSTTQAVDMSIVP